MGQALFWGAARGVGGGCRRRRIRGCRWLGGDRVRGRTQQDGKRIGAGCRGGRGRRWRDDRPGGRFFPQLFFQSPAAFPDVVRPHDRKEQRQAQERSGGVFGNFGKGGARAGAEQGVGSAAAKGNACAGFFFRQLDQHQQNQQQTVEHQNDCQQANNKR